MASNPVIGYTNAFKLNLTNFSMTADLIQKYEQQNWVAVDGLFQSILGGVASIWQNGTAYTLYQRVYDPTTGILYTCFVPHTSPPSGTFLLARSLNPSYWIGIDKSSFGLNNVDNTSDVDKPVSTATALAISAAVSSLIPLYVAQFKQQLVKINAFDTVQNALPGQLDPATISWTTGGAMTPQGPLGVVARAALGYDIPTFANFCLAATLNTL